MQPSRFASSPRSPHERHLSQKQQESSPPRGGSATTTAAASTPFSSSTLVAPLDVSSLAALQSMTSVTAVNKGLTSLRSVLHLEHLHHLRHLNLHMNQITHLDPAVVMLPSFANLVELDLSGNDLESMRGVEHMKRLEVLNLASNRLRALEGLVALHELERLNVAFNLLEDLLGLREAPGGRLIALDVSGNLLQRPDSLAAASHCNQLRELRVTVARPPISPGLGAPRPQDGLPEPTLQLLDNPFVAVPSYIAIIREALPQLVTLDGERVGFDPLAAYLSSGGASPAASSRPDSTRKQTAHHSDATVASPSRHAIAALADDTPKRIEEYLNSIEASEAAAAGAASLTPMLAFQLGASANASQAMASSWTPPRMKRISRSSQTAESGAPLVPKQPVTRSFSCNTDGSSHATVGALESIQFEARIIELEANAERHAAAARKAQQLLSVEWSGRENVIRQRDEAIGQRETLTHEVVSLQKQIAALKSEVQRREADAEQREAVALKMQAEKMAVTTRERVKAERESWQKRLRDVQSEMKDKFDALREEHESALRASSHASEQAMHAISASHQRAVQVLEDELRSLRTRHAADVSASLTVVMDMVQRCEDRVRQWMTRAFMTELEGLHAGFHGTAAVVQQQSAHRYMQQLGAALRHEEARNRDLEAAMDAVSRKSHEAHRQLEALVHQQQQRLARQQDASTSTITPSADESINERSDPKALASQILALEVSHREAVQRAWTLETNLHEAEATISELRDTARRLSQTHESEVAGLKRTIENLKASLVQQDESHRQEVEDMEAEFREKIEEKRVLIRTLQDDMVTLKRSSDMVGKDLAKSAHDAEVAAERERHIVQLEARCAQAEGELERRREQADGLQQQNQRLVTALQTLRQQLIAVDHVNRTLVNRSTEQERALRDQSVQLESLQRQLHESSVAQVQLKERVRQMAAAALSSS